MIGYYLGIQTEVKYPDERPGWLVCQDEDRKPGQLTKHWWNQVMTEPWGSTVAFFRFDPFLK